MQDQEEKMPPGLSRRGFLKWGAVVCAAALPLQALASAGALHERRLSFYHTHTGETLNATYWADGGYVQDGLADIYRLLRDFRSGEVSAIDNRLLDLLHTLSVTLDTSAQFHVISGYRSPKTNAMLANRGRGVARHSLHMDGLAIDIRIPGRDLAKVRKAALALQGGGVGYYPGSNFVHVDVGRVRQWVG